MFTYLRSGLVGISGSISVLCHHQLLCRLHHFVQGVHPELISWMFYLIFLFLLFDQQWIANGRSIDLAILAQDLYPEFEKLRAWVYPSLIFIPPLVLAMSRRSGSWNVGYGAQGRGGGGGGGQWSGQRSGPNMAHNPYVVQMPRFMEPIAEGPEPEDQSMIVIDNRDYRMVSPFQTW